MQLLILILNRTEYLDKLLHQLAETGIKGATILDSTGMARALGDKEGLEILGSLRCILSPERSANKTILMVLKEEEVGRVRETINKVVGGLDRPDTGILFSMPVLFVEGMNR